MPTNLWVRNSGRGTAGVFSLHSTISGASPWKTQGPEAAWGLSRCRLLEYLQWLLCATQASLQHSSCGAAGLLTWQLRAPKVSVPRNKAEATSSSLTYLGNHAASFPRSPMGYKGLTACLDSRWVGRVVAIDPFCGEGFGPVVKPILSEYYFCPVFKS